MANADSYKNAPLLNKLLFHSVDDPESIGGLNDTRKGSNMPKPMHRLFGIFTGRFSHL